MSPDEVPDKPLRDKKKLTTAQLLDKALVRIAVLEKKEKDNEKLNQALEIKIEINKSGVLRLTEGQDRNTTFMRKHTHNKKVPPPGKNEEPGKD